MTEPGGPDPRRRCRPARHLGRVWPHSERASRSGSATSTTSTCAPPADWAPGPRHRPEGAAQLTVVAVPPDHIAEAVVEALERGGVVTDVGSVKSLPLTQIADHVERGRCSPATSAATRWPAASGPGPWPPRAALFDGRPWAVTPHTHSSPEAVDAGRDARPALRRRAGPALPGRARPRGRAYLAPAAPARRAHRGPARRGPARAPLAVGPGRARRDPDRGRRPGHVGPDHPGQPGGGERDPARRAGRPRAAGRGAGERRRGVARRDPRPWRRRHPGHPRQARRPGDRDGLGVRLGARPPRRAGPAVRRRGRDRRQHRGPAHRPRPGSPRRARRAGGGGHSR